MSESGKKQKQRAPRLGKGLSSLMARPVSIDPQEVLPPQKSPGESIPDIAAPPLDEQTQPLADAASPADAPATQASEKGGQVPDPAPEQTPEEPTQGLVYLPLSDIQANPNQPRKYFNEQALQQLAESIKAAGLMQPIVVCPISSPASETLDSGADAESASYQVVAGERRWRAARIAGLSKIPALIRILDERQVAQWALIENLQREDLNPLERANAFANLIDQFEMNHEQVAQSVGVERPTVSNSLRLLALCEPVQQLIVDGHLSAGQGRALAAVENVEQQVALATQAVRQSWSVRQVEQAVRQVIEPHGQDGAGGVPGLANNSASSRAAHLADMEKQLGEQLGTKIKIKLGRKKGSGKLMINFYSLDQFDDLLTRLGVAAE